MSKCIVGRRTIDAFQATCPHGVDREQLSRHGDFWRAGIISHGDGPRHQNLGVSIANTEKLGVETQFQESSTHKSKQLARHPKYRKVCLENYTYIVPSPPIAGSNLISLSGNIVTVVIAAQFLLKFRVLAPLI